MTQFIWDLRFAFGLLTRLPIGPRERAPAERAARTVWAYPIAGAVVGAAAAGALMLSPNALLGAVLAYTAALLFTGALHEDALADICDAAGAAHRGPEAARKAMKDSAIGAMGALGLIADAGLRIASIAALPPELAIAALIAGAALSRSAAVWALRLATPKTDGLAASVGPPERKASIAAAAIALAAVGAGALVSPIMITLAFGLLPAIWVGRRAAGYAGGASGDMAGASLRAAETGGFVALALVYGAVL